MADVFISYSREDKDFVIQLHKALEVRNREAWVDLEDIPPIVDWWEKIEKGIEEARAFVFVISPNSVVSQVGQQEVEYALTNHKRLIPVVYRDVEPEAAPVALHKLQWIFLREQDDFEKGVDTLLKSVDLDLEWVDAHTDLLGKAIEWEQKSREKSRLLQGQELREAEAWLAESGTKEPKPTELQGQFILASRQGETERLTDWLGAAVFTLLIISGLLIYAIYLYRQSEARRRVAFSRQLAVQSLQILDTQYDLALLLGVEALEVANTLEAKSCLLTGLIQQKKSAVYLQGHKASCRSIAFNKDCTILASGHWVMISLLGRGIKVLGRARRSAPPGSQCSRRKSVCRFQSR